MKKAIPFRSFEKPCSNNLYNQRVNEFALVVLWGSPPDCNRRPRRFAEMFAIGPASRVLLHTLLWRSRYEAIHQARFVISLTESVACRPFDSEASSSCSKLEPNRLARILFGVRVAI